MRLQATGSASICTGHTPFAATSLPHSIPTCTFVRVLGTQLYSIVTDDIHMYNNMQWYLVQMLA